MVQTESEVRAENESIDIEAFARSIHDIWIEVEVTTVEAQRKVCRWDELPEMTKTMYREMAVRRWRNSDSAQPLEN